MKVFSYFCFAFKPLSLICLYTFLLFAISLIFPEFQPHLSTWLSFLWYSLFGKGQSAKVRFKLSCWDPVVLHNLNKLEEFFLCVIAFYLCLKASVMLRGYRNVSPVKLQPAMVQYSGVANKWSDFLGNKLRSNAM